MCSLDLSTIMHWVFIVVPALGAVALVNYLASKQIIFSEGYKWKGAPQIPGLPLVGNTLSLARHGAAFIHMCRMQV